MNNKLYFISALGLFSFANVLYSITSVTMYNKTTLPVTLEVTLHYYQKKVPSLTSSGAYTYIMKPVDEAKATMIPIGSWKILAQNTFIDKITVHKVWITKSTQTITVPIEQTFTLTTSQESQADANCAVITLNHDYTFSIIPQATSCAR